MKKLNVTRANSSEHEPIHVIHVCHLLFILLIMSFVIYQRPGVILKH